MTIQTFDATASPEDVANATFKDGAAIVTGLIFDDFADKISAELSENLDTFGYKSKRDFSGHFTNRCHDVLEQAPSSLGLINHDMVTGVLDELLLPHCESYRIGSITAIEVCPGQEEQDLHRDDCIYPIHLPGMETLISCMWAVTDFTQKNGATRVAVGAHRQLNMADNADTSNVQQAIMPKGSALFYLGSTIHGAGANQSDDARLGLITTYSLGWLRQEVSQYLNVPMELVRTYDDRMRALLGYTTHDTEGLRIGKYYGSDETFIDKDDFAKHYRPYSPKKTKKD